MVKTSIFLLPLTRLLPPPDSVDDVGVVEVKFSVRDDSLTRGEQRIHFLVRITITTGVNFSLVDGLSRL